MTTDDVNTSNGQDAETTQRTADDLEVDITIVGGGLVGASLALALAPRWRVCLLELAVPTPPPDDACFDQRVYAVSPGSRAFIDSIGGWQVPAQRLGPVQAMDVRGDAGGAIYFDALELATDELAVIVENRALQWSLWQALPASVTVIASAAKEVHFGEDAVTLQLADGRHIRSRLAVAADGANSWLRKAAGIAFTRHPYPQLGVVGNFSTTRPHVGVARQWFRDDGILAWLPLSGNKVSMVWSCEAALADELKALAPEALAQRVADAGGNSLGDMQAMTPLAAFPLAFGRAAQTTGARLALVGDAAHTIHPLAGQGVNLGFGDAKALAALLTSPDTLDPGSARLLSHYARQRAEEVLAMQLVCDGLQKLFSCNYPGVAGLRNMGLNAANWLGPIKRQMMQQAFR